MDTGQTWSTQNWRQRAIDIVRKPKAILAVFDSDDTLKISSLYTTYILKIAMIGPVCGFLGGQILGYGSSGSRIRPGFNFALQSATLFYVLSLVSVAILALIIDWLAPRFGGVADRRRAFLLAAFSFTPIWLVGIFGLFPALSRLTLLGTYGFYLLWIGLPVLMKTHGDKSFVYAAATLGTFVGGCAGVMAALSAILAIPPQGTTAAYLQPSTAVSAIRNSRAEDRDFQGFTRDQRRAYEASEKQAAQQREQARLARCVGYAGDTSNAGQWGSAFNDC